MLYFSPALELGMTLSAYTAITSIQPKKSNCFMANDVLEYYLGGQLTATARNALAYLYMVL